MTYRERLLALAAEPIPYREKLAGLVLLDFDESKVERDERGRFASQGGSGANFANAPDGTGRTKWVKEQAANYANDPEFRAAVDAVTLLTQGQTREIHMASLAAAGGDVEAELRKGGRDEQYVAFMTGGLDKDLSWAAHPMAEYKNYFPGQDVSEAHYTTLRDAGAALNRAIETAPKLSEPIYRGLHVPVDAMERATAETVNENTMPGGPGEHGFNRVTNPAWTAIENLKAGDSFPVPGVASFTLDKGLAEQFSKGTATGQIRAKEARKEGPNPYMRSVTLEIAPGARGLKVAGLSPWAKQKEVLTRGNFKVQRVDRTMTKVYSRYGGSHDVPVTHIVLEQAE